MEKPEFVTSSASQRESFNRATRWFTKMNSTLNDAERKVWTDILCPSMIKCMQEERDTTLEDIGWPPVIDAEESPIKLTRKFRDLARGWRVPAESLASYVCEEYGDTHSPEQPLLLIVVTAKKITA